MEQQRVIRNTSIEALKEIEANGLLGRLQLEVQRAVVKHGPITIREIHDRFFSNYSDCSISPRVRELFQMGSIREFDKRFCTVSGMKATAWIATGALPCKLKKEITKDEKIKRLKAAITVSIKQFKLYKDVETVNKIMDILNGK